MKWLGWCWLLLLTSITMAQTPAEITTEPHHHLLLENSRVRVFALTLRPTDQAYVRHDHNFMMVMLLDAELVMWPEGKSAVQNFRFLAGNARFYLGGTSIGLRNDRSSDFKGFVVEFLDPKVTTYGYQYQSGNWDYAGGAINPPVDPHAKFIDRMLMGAGSVADVQLLAGDAFPSPEKPAAELLIPITDVDLKNGTGAAIHISAGEVVWIGEGRESGLVNASEHPERFVMIELR